ncbi:MAG TPA: YkgJ family cysteine cluster protein [Armatimonadota bacterium]|nr:YkgJ family cysteine cluster protein [Armatimonadota bacterium]HOS42782.1 YkgJ family cysteine cluster protein [Armatimonadota bacterium]
MTDGHEDDRIPCRKCGTCCIAPDISTLKKPIGVPCAHLTAEHMCGIYPERPAVCREYQPDELCVALQAVPPEERVLFYLRYYGLEGEAPSR